MVTKINPVYDITLPRAFVGKTISEFNIDLGADASASTGPDGAIYGRLKRTPSSLRQRAQRECPRKGHGDLW